MRVELRENDLGSEFSQLSIQSIDGNILISTVISNIRALPKNKL